MVYIYVDDDVVEGRGLNHNRVAPFSAGGICSLVYYYNRKGD